MMAFIYNLYLAAFVGFLGGGWIFWLGFFN